MSRNTLYVVYAVFGKDKLELYSTTKENKAYKYLHDYQRQHNNVDRMYIDKKVITRFNKRDYIEDEDL